MSSTAERVRVPQEKQNFDFHTAFSRTRGLLTRDEMELLRTKRVAIAGMGGVGGIHLLTLTRLGIGCFHIADFDRFELHNFNRQAGAYLAHIGRPKVEVMEEMAKGINPEIQIEKFVDGVNKENVARFFSGVDIYVDSLDFFAFNARRIVLEYCHTHQIPIVIAGPIAMGVALLVFQPGGMDPISYFDWKAADSDEELGAKFLLGLTPSAPHRKQIVEPTAIDLAAHRGPSTPMGCELCAGAAGVEVMKLITKRGRILCAPHSIHFDAFENKLHSRYIWRGNRNPLQKLKIAMALRQLRKQRTAR